MSKNQQEAFTDELREAPLEAEAGDRPEKPHANRGRPLPPVETRWKKGESGNPRGRPKKRDTLTDLTLANLIRQTLRKRCHMDREKRTWGELLVHALLQSALKGNASASKLILERHDGKEARAEDPMGKNSWERKSPAEREKSSMEALHAIREIFGFPEVDSSTKDQKLPEPIGAREAERPIE